VLFLIVSLNTSVNKCAKKKEESPLRSQLFQFTVSCIVYATSVAVEKNRVAGIFQKNIGSKISF